MSLNLEAGLRQPIEELIAQGFTGPWVVICNRLAYAPGEYDSELGKVIVHSNLFYMPVDDLTVTTLESWQAFEADQQNESKSPG